MRLLEDFFRDRFQKHRWEVRELGDVASICRGTDVTREQMVGSAPAVKAEDINMDFLNHRFDRCISFVEGKMIKNPKYFERGDILMVCVGNIGKCCIYTGEEKGIFGNGVYKIHEYKGDPRYLSYALATREVKRQIKELTTKASYNSLYIERARKINILYPPEEIQAEIADFLDGFISIEKGLEAELENHRKQYFHWLDGVLEEELKGCPTKAERPLESIGHLSLGQDHKIERRSWKIGNFPIFRWQDIGEIGESQFEKCVSYVNLEWMETGRKYFSRGDILIAVPKIKNFEERVFLYTGGERCLLGKEIIALKHRENPKYLHYILSSKEARRQLMKMGDRKSLTNLKKLRICIPDAGTQEKIIGRLERFREVFSSIERLLRENKNYNRKYFDFYREKIISV